MQKTNKNLISLLYTAVLFLFINSFVQAQEKRDFRFSVGGGFASIHDRIYYSPCIEGEYFLSEKWSLNYSLGYGKTNRGDIQFHFPLAWLAIPFACDPEAIIFCAMVPEGVSYHLYPKEKMEVAPYINLLQAQCVFSDEEMLNVLSGAGVKVYFKPAEKISIAFQYGISVPYNRPELYFNAGISLGVMF